MKKLLSILILSVFTTMGFAQVRISQVYGGGGAGSGTFTYNRDFIEIFNAGSTTVSLSGMSVQYASAAGTSWTATALSGTLQPGQYYLIGESTGTAGGTLPAADASGTIAMSATAGKVLLANQATAVAAATTPTSSVVLDWVAYGSTATPAEGGSPTPAPSALNSIFRASNGCIDTDNNANDFTATTALARNTASALSPCSGGPVASLVIASNITGLTTVSGTASASPASFTVSGTNLTGFPGNLTVTATSNIEISTTSGGTYTNSLSVPYTSATLTAVTLYARIKSMAPLGALSGETITVSGGGAATSPSITVSGNVVAAEPTVQATNVTITNITNTTFDINWTNGNGSSRIGVIRATTTTSVPPADGTVYSASTSPGANITGSGNFVFFSGTGSGPVTFTGLTPGTAYSVQIYEYNGGSGTANYNINIDTGNPLVATTTGISPNIQQVNFTGISVPLYMSANSATNRVPVMFYARVTNLAPNTAYRYFTGGANQTDFNTTSIAGLPVLIDYNNGNAISIPSSGTINAATASGNFGTFTSDASGSFMGSFGLVPSNNTKFSASTLVYPVLSLGVDNGTSTTVQLRLALDQSITPLAFGATITDGTFIKGASSAAPKNLVALWKSQDGSSFVQATARPLSITFAENTGATTTYISGYDNAAGSWNTIIPNNNANGVRLIQQLDLVSGATVGCTSDADGVWPSGANTVNPTGATTPIGITSTDAPLTAGACFSVLAVNLTNFTAAKKGNAVQLNWATAQEVNSNRFEVLRSSDGVNWKLITSVTAAGNSNTTLNYAAMDNAPLSGKNLYRLRSIDNDGKATLSDIRTVIFSDRFEILVSPNPVKDVININISKQGNAPVQIALISSTGAVVRRYTTNSTFYSISAAGLNKGLYIVKIVSEDASATEKIIIQ